MDIEINCSEVTNCGNEMKDYVDNFGDEISKFSSIIDSINSIWDGADALKYINAMREGCLEQLNIVKDIFDEYGEYLQKVSKPYEELDESFASRTIDV